MEFYGRERLPPMRQIVAGKYLRDRKSDNSSRNTYFFCIPGAAALCQN